MKRAKGKLRINQMFSERAAAGSQRCCFKKMFTLRQHTNGCQSSPGTHLPMPLLNHPKRLLAEKLKKNPRYLFCIFCANYTELQIELAVMPPPMSHHSCLKKTSFANSTAHKKREGKGGVGVVKYILFTFCVYVHVQHSICQKGLFFQPNGRRKKTGLRYLLPEWQNAINVVPYGATKQPKKVWGSP